MVRALVLWCLAMCMALPAWGQNVTLRTGPNQLSVGQSVLFAIAIVNAEPTSIPKIKAPEGLRIDFERPERSSRTNIERGRMTVRKTLSYVYRVTALEEGNYQLGPYAIDLTTGTQRTGVWRIAVSPQPDIDDSPIHAEAGFLDTEVWEGQVVLYRYAFSTRISISRSSWQLPHPNWNGLVPPRDGGPTRRNAKISDERGEVALDETFIPLVVTGLGDLTQSPAVVRVDVPTAGARRDPFRDPFGSIMRTKPRTFATERAILTSKPLPEAPDNFTGLVGELQLKASIDKKAVAVGESVTWTVTVDSTGTLEGFALPQPKDLDGAQIYDNGPSVSAGIVDDRYVSRGVFERVVVPTQQGSLVVPDLAVVYFSPAAGKYVTAMAKGGTISVAAGTEVAANVESFLAIGGSGPVVRVAEDIRPVWRSGSEGTWSFAGWMRWMLLVFSLPGGWVLAKVGQEHFVAYRRSVIVEKAPTAVDRLASLPTDPAERLAVFEAALSQAAQDASPGESLAQEFDELSRSLRRARFAGDASGDLEPSVRALVQRLLEAT